MSDMQVKREQWHVRLDRIMLTEMIYYRDRYGVNWSEVCRKAIQRKINQLDKER